MTITSIGHNRTHCNFYFLFHQDSRRVQNGLLNPAGYSLTLAPPKLKKSWGHAVKSKHPVECADQGHKHTHTRENSLLTTGFASDAEGIQG